MSKLKVSLVSVTLLTILFTSFSQTAFGEISGPANKGKVRAAEAIARLGERLPQVAREYKTDAKKLHAAFLRDNDFWLDSNDRCLYLCQGLVTVDTTVQNSENTAAASFPLSETFLLHSRPESTRVIYLDFDGFIIRL